MSTGDKFKIISPTLGIMSTDGHRIPITLPKNSIIEVVTGLVNHERMVDVRWEGLVVMVFAQDVRERAQATKD